MEIVTRLGMFTVSLDVNADMSVVDRPIWFHLVVGNWLMSGGEHMSATQAREFAAALVAVADAADAIPTPEK